MTTLNSEHTLMAIVREKTLFVVWCGCGWMSKAGTSEDCFAYFDRHATHRAGAAVSG